MPKRKEVQNNWQNFSTERLRFDFKNFSCQTGKESEWNNVCMEQGVLECDRPDLWFQFKNEKSRECADNSISFEKKGKNRNIHFS